MENNIRRLEYAMLKAFNASLTEEEKMILSDYKLKFPKFFLQDDERRRANLMMISFIEGYRCGKTQNMDSALQRSS